MRPETLTELLALASKKAPQLWPAREGATAAALVDEDDCAVDDDNFVLVQPGALLFVEPTVSSPVSGTSPSLSQTLPSGFRGSPTRESRPSLPPPPTPQVGVHEAAVNPFDVEERIVRLPGSGEPVQGGAEVRIFSL